MARKAANQPWDRRALHCQFAYFVWSAPTRLPEQHLGRIGKGVKSRLDDRVALARRPLQPGAVEDLESIHDGS